MKKLRIWLVDSDPVDSLIIKEMLEINELSREVKLFLSHEDALDKLQGTEPLYVPDVIISENNQPYINAWEFLKKAKELNISLLKTQFHIISNAIISQDFEIFKKIKGMTSIRRKPVRLDDLIHIARKP